MMKTSELRIGNWVNYILKEGEWSMTGLMATQVVSIGSHDLVTEMESIPLDMSYFEPIPITPEWLDKFGLEKDNDNEYAFNMEGYNWTIRIHDGLIGLDYHEYHPTQRIKYVHQLQNLYFALTGEEL